MALPVGVGPHRHPEPTAELSRGPRRNLWLRRG